jgi:hypothetical protein
LLFIFSAGSFYAFFDGNGFFDAGIEAVIYELVAIVPGGETFRVGFILMVPYTAGQIGADAGRIKRYAVYLS